jgi:diguanylate cyclase (GGDEF)-like protein
MNHDRRALPPDPATVPEAPGLQRTLADLVLTNDYRQRRCLRVLMLTVAVYGVSVALMIYGAMAGIFEPLPVYGLSALIVVATISFYAIIRSGLNLRFAEPTLAFPQALVAQTIAAGAYAFSGPVHPATLMLFALIMIFSMFDMRVFHARLLTLYSVALVGAVILWRVNDRPDVYVPRLELIYFVIDATVLGAISQLSVLLSTMRRRLKTQKAELQAALLHIHDMATHDELTGLSNRRQILAELAAHALRQSRGGPAFYVVMADLDHFKRINDAYGHAVGDDALTTFARVAQEQLRNTDVVGRWGGEEFLLVMPETPPGDPNVGLERLRERLAASEASDAVTGVRVHFSAGVSRHRDGEDVEATIERADRAVYAAKAAGRNRTVAL